MKAVFKWKCNALSAYIRKEESSKINTLCLYLSKLKKSGKLNPK